MASPPARSDPFPSAASSLASRCRELAARLLARDGDNYDASLPPARRQDCPNERIIDLQEVAKTCGAGLIEQAAKEGETTFVLDSGASYHVVGDVSILSSFTAFAAAAPAYPARDGRQLVVAGVGTISWGSFHLSDVLYVPGLPAGVVLVSVRQLVDLGYFVMCGGGRCHVKDQITGDIVGNGRLHSQNGVYQLEFLKIPPDTTDTTAPDPLHCHSSTL